LGPLLTGKIAKIVIYDRGQVNGGTKYDSPGPCWVPKPVFNNILTKYYLKNIFLVIFVLFLLYYTALTNPGP